MENKRKLPMPGEYYRHFKGHLYEVLTVATHTETEEKLVIYRALYGSRQDYARPVHMFLSEVDHDKYPDAGQRYRFEKAGDCVHGIEAGMAGTDEAAEAAGAAVSERNMPGREDPGAEAGIESYPETYAPREGELQAGSPASDSEAEVLLHFLNAEGLQEKLEVIRQNRTRIDQRFIDSAAMALDIVVREGELDDRLRELCRNLQLMAQYESRRLR